MLWIGHLSKELINVNNTEKFWERWIVEKNQDAYRKGLISILIKPMPCYGPPPWSDIQNLGQIKTARFTLPCLSQCQWLQEQGSVHTGLSSAGVLHLVPPCEAGQAPQAPAELQVWQEEGTRTDWFLTAAAQQCWLHGACSERRAPLNAALWHWNSQLGRWNWTQLAQPSSKAGGKQNFITWFFSERS